MSFTFYFTIKITPNNPIKKEPTPQEIAAIEVKSVIQQGSRLLLQVGVDYKFLRDACKVLTKTCIISCSAPDAPIVIREGNTLILIMPRLIEH